MMSTDCVARKGNERLNLLERNPCEVLGRSSDLGGTGKGVEGCKTIKLKA